MEAFASELRGLVPLGIQITAGTKFLALTWSAFALMFLGNSYVSYVYWKEFRGWTIGKRDFGSGGEEKEVFTAKGP